LEKGLTAKIFDKQCELLVIRMPIPEATLDVQGKISVGRRENCPKKAHHELHEYSGCIERTGCPGQAFLRSPDAL
jgi:hypothetical protein